MALDEHANGVHEITRYGVDYDVYRFEAGVRCVVPQDELNLPDEDTVLAFVECMQRRGCVDEGLPIVYGYDVERIHHPLWPNSGRSNVYYHSARDEYLKMPVEVKNGALQFFAMNGIARALNESPDAHVIYSRTLIASSMTRSTTAFLEGAQGVSARRTYLTLSREGLHAEADDFRRKLERRTADVIRQVPRWLRPIFNDNPGHHPLLGTGQGMQNVFLDGALDGVGATDPETARVIFIDQAHPTIPLLGYHAVVKYFGPLQPSRIIATN